MVLYAYAASELYSVKFLVNWQRIKMEGKGGDMSGFTRRLDDYCTGHSLGPSNTNISRWNAPENIGSAAAALPSFSWGDEN